MAEAQAQRWVTFDCYGTLVDWRTGMREALAAVGGETLHRLLEAYHRHEHAVEAGPFRPYRDVLRESLLHASRELGVQLPRGDADVLSESLPEWPVFGDVPDALTELRASGSRLGILSNVDRDLISGTLRRLPGEIDSSSQQRTSARTSRRRGTSSGSRRSRAPRPRPGSTSHAASSTT